MGMEERVNFGPLQRTSKVLTAEELLKDMDTKAPLTAEVTSKYSLVEQKANYEKAKKFLDLKLAGKLNSGLKSTADDIVSEITTLFGEGMAWHKKTTTIDGRNEDVYIIGINFPEIKKRFYPDMPMPEAISRAMEVSKEEYGQTG